eukprot:3461948-Rhodomonas_salina.1
MVSCGSSIVQTRPFLLLCLPPRHAPSTRNKMRPEQTHTLSSIPLGMPCAPSLLVPRAPEACAAAGPPSVSPPAAHSAPQ